MANIKSIAGIDYNGWELTYEVDFGDYNSGGNMSDDDTITIDGVTWTAGITNGTLEVKPANGILMTPGGSSDWFSGGPACPLLYADLNDLIPNLSAEDTICVQWIQDYPDGIPANNYEGVGMNLWDGVGAGTWKGMGGGVVYNDTQAGSSKHFVRALRGNTTQGLISNANEFNTFEVVYYMTGQCAIASSAATGVKAFSEPLVVNATRQYANYGTTIWTETQATTGITTPLTVANTRVAFFGMQVNTARTFRGLIEKVRVFRCRTSN